jgi:hypothetical protein
MCVIVAKPKGVELNIEELHNCWQRNPDGAGFAYAEFGEVKIDKGYMEEDKFFERLIAPGLKSWTSKGMVLHFRIRTHGDTDEENTHPFEVVPGKLAFAHNGVLHGFEVKGREHLSDTQVFNRYILKQLPQNFLSNQGIVWLIGDLLGGNNKLAFIDQDGEITLFNKERGLQMENGLWYSNSWSREPYIAPAPAQAPKGSGYDAFGWDWKRRNYRDYRDEDRDVLPRTAIPVATEEEREEEIFDWYCWDCAMWFDSENNSWAGEDPGLPWVNAEIAHEDIPICPSCGSNIAVEPEVWAIDETTPFEADRVDAWEVNNIVGR